MKSLASILQDFKDWVGHQHPNKTYNFPSGSECAVGLFLRATGHAITTPHLNPLDGCYLEFHKGHEKLCRDAFEITHGHGGFSIMAGTGPTDWTFGKLHERLKAYHP